MGKVSDLDNKRKALSDEIKQAEISKDTKKEEELAQKLQKYVKDLDKGKKKLEATAQAKDQELKNIKS